MRGTIAIAWVLVMWSGGVWAAQSAPQPPPAQKTDVAIKTKAKKSRKGVVPTRQLPAQTMPPVPATLMNSTPVSPRVTMDGGLLTIDAPNSTLSDVLSGVHNATGAAIEGATPSERVAVKLGPGNPEQVLAALLRGTSYDYVILGSLGKQDVVTRVLLTQQSSQAEGGQPAQTQSSPQQTRQQQPTEETMPDRTVPEDAAAQPNADGEPEQAQQPPQPPAQQPPQAQQDPNQPKTPEQLFKELQQLEQQKQPR